MSVCLSHYHPTVPACEPRTNLARTQRRGPTLPPRTSLDRTISFFPKRSVGPEPGRRLFFRIERTGRPAAVRPVSIPFSVPLSTSPTHLRLRADGHSRAGLSRLYNLRFGRLESLCASTRWCHSTLVDYSVNRSDEAESEKIALLNSKLIPINPKQIPSEFSSSMNFPPSMTDCRH